MSFKNNAERLRDVLKKAKKHGLDSSGNMFDFKSKRKESYDGIIKSCLNAIKKNDLGNYEINEHIKDLDVLLGNGKIDSVIENLNKILVIYNGLSVSKVKNFKINFSKIPVGVRDEVKADFTELEKCFNAKLFRSAVILCGRILEVCLHRKYYEFTGVDALEKSPGIGLGKLVAKLVDKEVKFEPGLTQQIHLINQVRVGSVHKRKEIFNPSAEQTHAMILFTLDIVNKLF